MTSSAELFALAPAFPPRAAQVVREALGLCQARGFPAPPAPLRIEPVAPSALGTAYARCHEATADATGQLVIRIEVVAAVLPWRERSRLRVPFGLHALWHEYAHALDQELRAAPAEDGTWGRFGRYTRHVEWQRLFLDHRYRRLPYLSPLARRGVEEFFAEAFVAYVGRPALLSGPGRPLAMTLDATLTGNGVPTYADQPAIAPARPSA